MIRLIVIYAVLLVVFLIPDGLEWWGSQSALAKMFTHHFFHGNFFHLLANGFTLYLLNPRTKNWQIAAAYAIASLSVLPTSCNAIGFSNIIYATIGIQTPSFKSYWWRHPGTLIFLGVTLLMLLLPNVSAVTHIVSFAIGVLVSATLRNLKEIENDSARYI